MKKVRRILVVDGSRVIRATLVKHLKGDDFEVMEEANGESAWQTLMLDASIDLIISGVHTPKLEAHDLLARLKASTKRRLREMPFVLIVSDLDHPAELEEDRRRGVSGFITKSMSKPEIVACLNAWLEPPPPPAFVPELVPSAAAACPSPKEKRLLDEARFRAEVSGFTADAIKVESICVLVFGIDKRDALIGRFGDGVGEIIRARIAALLSGKVEISDVLGCYGGERLAIVSRGVDLKHGVRFAKRVCKSLAAGQLTIHGQKVKLTASVGVASSSDDAVNGGEELLMLAVQRLDQALLCGGNTVSSDLRSACPLQCHGRRGLDLLEVLLAESGDAGGRLPSCLGSLGLQVMPLLKAMDAELGLALPLNEIEMKLRQRANAEEKACVTEMPEFAGETRH